MQARANDAYTRIQNPAPLPAPRPPPHLYFQVEYACLVLLVQLVCFVDHLGAQGGHLALESANLHVLGKQLAAGTLLGGLRLLHALLGLGEQGTAGR